jgi:hypothetical protein
MDTNKPKGTFAKLMSSASPLPQPDTFPQQEVREVQPPGAEAKTEVKSQEQKKLLGARITPQQYALFKKLYLQLNNNDSNSNIDKGEIVGLAIETLADLLTGTSEDFSTVNKLKSYLVNKVTNVPKS